MRIATVRTTTALCRRAIRCAGAPLVISTLLLGTIVHGAQDKPDFTGEWDLSDSDDAGPNIARGLSIRPTVDGGLPALMVERQFEDGVREERYTRGVRGTVGGSSGQARRPAPRQTRLSVTWDADRLVIDWGDYAQGTRDAGPWTEQTEVWSLDSQGLLHIVKTQRSSTTEPRTTRYAYRRR